MDLRHLRYFLALSEELHFTRAAERLNIVQPALSAQIKALEEELGAALFIRSRRKVELTAAGIALIPEARRVQEQVRQAAQIVKLTAAGLLGQVRIGYSANALYSGIMAKAIHALRLSCPDIELHVDEVHPHSQYEALRKGRFDVSFGPVASLPPAPEFERITLASYPVRVVLPAGHVLCRNQIIDPEALREEQFIGYAGEHDTAGSHMARSILGYSPTFGFQARSPSIAVGLVEAGLGVAVLSSVLESRFSDGVVYRPILGADVRIDVTFVARRDEMNPAVLALRRVAQSIAADGAFPPA